LIWENVPPAIPPNGSALAGLHGKAQEVRHTMNCFPAKPYGLSCTNQEIKNPGFMAEIEYIFVFIIKGLIASQKIVTPNFTPGLFCLQQPYCLIFENKKQLINVLSLWIQSQGTPASVFLSASPKITFHFCLIVTVGA